MHSEILSFISRFTDGGRRSEVIDTFSNGCCYWFARILKERFGAPPPQNTESEIVYDEVMNHFAYRYAGVVYDITGEVTNRVDCFKPWREVKDPLLVWHVIRDSILYLPHGA